MKLSVSSHFLSVIEIFYNLKAMSDIALVVEEALGQYSPAIAQEVSHLFQGECTLQYLSSVLRIDAIATHSDTGAVNSFSCLLV